MGAAAGAAQIGRRLTFAACLAATIGLGLASRRFGADLPGFVAAYAGDVLWAAAAYLAIGIARPAAGIGRRAMAAFLLSAAVETSQLYHAPWIDGIRATLPGALLLGSGFLWSDIACYAVGATIGAAGEWSAARLPVR